VTAHRSTADAARVRRIVARLARAHPDARLALAFGSPFELLVALILAAQCTDERVNRVTATLFSTYPCPAALAHAPRAELEAAIRTTGFFRSKAKALQACAAALIARFGGEVPERLEDLLTLPGVGRKTANILIGNAFGRPAIGVDTHVMRLAQRLGLTRHTDPDRIEADLTAIVPRTDQVRFCHLLQFHGRRICVARAPRCPQCPIEDLCPYPQKTRPAPAGRARRTAAAPRGRVRTRRPRGPSGRRGGRAAR
jgi:endonuclease-3